MKAMIFAAGLGTRLRPLTNNKPKALVEINGMPLLEIIIRRLKHQGFNEIIVNVHHFADQVVDFLKKNNNFNIHIEISDETDLLLDTGGGLKKAAWFFQDTKAFLVHNVDIISDLNLTHIYYHHIKSKALATLAIQNRKTSRQLFFDSENNLCAWKNKETGEMRITRDAIGRPVAAGFSGIHILNSTLLNMITEEGVFSIIDVYLRLAREHKITSYNHDDSLWLDLGRFEHIDEASKLLKERKLF